MAAELGHHRTRENKLGTGWPGVEQEGARGTPASAWEVGALLAWKRRVGPGTLRPDAQGQEMGGRQPGVEQQV